MGTFVMMRLAICAALVAVALSAPTWTSQLAHVQKAETQQLSSSSCSSDGWTLLLRQTVSAGYMEYDSWMSWNTGDPSQPNYSILNTLDDTYKNQNGTDGKFQFKIVWPLDSGNNYNEWKQTTNPVTSTDSVSGYEGINIYFTSNRWGGIENGKRHGGNTPYAALDGSVDHGNWYYAIGSRTAWNNGIPGASSAENGVEFYVKGCATTTAPTATPTTLQPTAPPTPVPSHTPTETPTTKPPSPSPSHTPTEHPTVNPTRTPTMVPTPSPTAVVSNCHCTGCESHYKENDHTKSSHEECHAECVADSNCKFAMFNTGTTKCYLYNAAQMAKISYVTLDSAAVDITCYHKA